MFVPLFEARRITNVTGLTEEQVERVIHAINQNAEQRAKSAALAKYREDHDL